MDSLRGVAVSQGLRVVRRALDDNFGFAVDCKDGRFPGLFQLTNMLPCIPLKVTQRVDVSDIDGHNHRLHEISCCDREAAVAHLSSQLTKVSVGRLPSVAECG